MSQKELTREETGLNEFAERLAEVLKEELGSGYTLSIKRQLKNNSTYLTGILVTEEGNAVSPYVYADDYYRKYCKIGDFKAVAEEFVRCCRTALKQPSFDLNSIRVNSDETRRSVYMRVINAAKNRELLSMVPHRTFLDLAVVYHRYVDVGENSVGGILITNEIAKSRGLTEDELFSLAVKNTPGMFPFLIQPITDMIARLSGIPKEALAGKGFPPEGIPLYVISNTKYTNGASCMLYPEFRRVVSERIDGDFYILPSSIHEIIVMPADRPADELLKMVREINATQVPAEEFLSDNVYRYSIAKGEQELIPNMFTEVPA